MEVRRADKIAETLEQLVFSGEFKDGERLDELKLAEQFCVSRTPIREALHALVASGMAEQIPRRGVFVRQPGPVELMEMFETMAELEAACGRYAALRITDSALDRLVAANENCQRALAQQDHAGYYAQNEIFHQVIYESAANSYLEKQALRLQNRLKPYRKVQLRFRGRLDQSMAEHVAIVAALQEGDPEQAAAALRGHVAVQGEKFYQLMASLNS
ncbi:GntR family transcriptional regulator [Yoonia sediminilitoris]|uniref:GntR family transcriptional regulator n=1 Tax=Yoonia sediminilitoris TaxID=1286148 RepID=A0A2T6KII7_9RHOB|nr:GntR family transcriptional regulator [Yoonia sediminilitoris]PUB15539.1 GntR family transcriptional regulator [Yoonia sediminilitoris]RCW96148.1 GntR family transcriptional regulator [Yoonia sediminilitoris]